MCGNNLQSNLSVRTPLYYGQCPMFRRNSHIFSLKKNSTIRTLSNIQLLYHGHSGDQGNPESRSGVSAQGESRLVWLMSYARWYKAQSLYTKQRFAKGVQRNITDFLKASITTDSIKIFSITFCTLVTVYCTCKIAKDAFRIVLYVTTFYMQHCALARFVLKH